MTETRLLTDEALAGLRAASADPSLRVPRNAVTEVGVDAVALDRRALRALAPAMALKLDELPVTDQGMSGRCWMFAAYNVFRHAVAKELNLDDFQFSQAHTQFHDKLERANHLLRTIATIDLPSDDPHEVLGDRTVAHLLSGAGDDGGWFAYFVNLVSKYGAVPREVMPDTDSAGRTRELNAALGTVLRRRASLIVAARCDGDDAAVGTHVEEGVREAHRILCAHLGAPPRTFTWRYLDKDGAYRSTGEITPAEFAARHLPADLGEWAVLGVDPRPGREVGVNYRVEHLSNVWGAPEHRYLNATSEDLLRATLSALDAGQPTWFACDVMRDFSRDHGAWDDGLLRLGELYGVDMATDMSGRASTRSSLPTHGMVVTGVDRDGDDPFAGVRALRVENSWGPKNRDKEEIPGKGYGQMTPEWFRENVFQVVVPRRHVPAHLAATLDDEPVTLPATDPMSAWRNA